MKEIKYWKLTKGRLDLYRWNDLRWSFLLNKNILIVNLGFIMLQWWRT
jgi:hypothetical protein